MAYTPKEWKDLPDETTPIQASDLNHIEQGIGDLSTKVDTLNTNVGDLSTLNTTNKSNLVGAINEVNSNDIRRSTYTTSEQVIGKWIDGKTLYRKIVSGNVPQSNSYPAVATGITNLDKVVSISVVLAYGDKRQYFTSVRYKNYYLSKENNNKITIVAPDVEGDATFTICYTKTTN